MLVVAPHGLIKRDLRQPASGDISEEILAVLEMRGAIGRTWRVAREVVERLMMRLKGERARAARVDHGALFLRIAPPIGERRVPAAAVPRPRHALGRERVA